MQIFILPVFSAIYENFWYPLVDQTVPVVYQPIAVLNTALLCIKNGTILKKDMYV